MTILVTGGSGFIGSNFILYSLNQDDEPHSQHRQTYVCWKYTQSCFCLWYKNYEFVHASIGDAIVSKRIFSRYSIRAIVNFAAESHVDRSISRPEIFFESNVLDTLRFTGRYQRLLPVVGWRRTKNASDFSTFQPTKYLARFGRMNRPLPRRTNTAPTAPTPPARLHPTTLSARMAKPTGCR